MATLTLTNPTLMDLAKRQDPNGKIADIVEILNAQNEILTDMTWLEGNLTTGHKTTIRTGIPVPTWRKFNQGVQPTKSTTAQIIHTTGMLEAYAKVDKAMVDMNGNAAAFRFQEDMAHLEGMNQEMSQTLFYGDEPTEPESFTGLSPHYNSLTAESGDNILDAGGTGTDNQSIWLIIWSPLTIHGIVPKGTTAGWQMEDLGEKMIQDQALDNTGALMQAYVTHYKWEAGLAVRDWRYAVRISNIDKSLLTVDYSTGANLIDLMAQAVELPPSLNTGRAVWYGSRDIKTWLKRQITNKVAQSTLTEDNVAGKRVMSFDGIPFRRCDALAADEARVT